MATISLADGTSVTVRDVYADRFLGLDAQRNQVLRDPEIPDLTYALTPCCQATGKGSDSPTGVVCRACYRTVPSYFGGQAEVAIGLDGDPFVVTDALRAELPDTITLDDLRAFYAELRADKDASSNDVGVMLDGFFTEHGWPSIIFA